MKYSTMMAIAFCGVLAVAVSGCKYDDDELGAGTGTELVDPGAGATDLDSNPDGVNAKDVASDVDEQNKLAAAAAAMKDADTVSMDAATGVPFDQDPNYVRCTDVDFAPVYFGFDSDLIPQGELAKAEAVAKHLAANSARVVIVEGNCDDRGSNEYNLSLGDLRAIKIRDYLVNLGVANPEARIQTKSYGEEKPAVQGAGEGAWSKNRRGEFAVFQHK